jgi:hypothetical protein
MPWRRMRDWRYKSIIINFSATWRWVLSFAPRPLYPQYPLDRRVSGLQEPVWTLWKKWRNFLLLPGIEPQFLVHPAHSLVAIPTELSALSWVMVGIMKWKHKGSGLVQAIILAFKSRDWGKPWTQQTSRCPMQMWTGNLQNMWVWIAQSYRHGLQVWRTRVRFPVGTRNFSPQRPSSYQIGTGSLSHG